MPRRRPPREGPVVNNLLRLAAAILFIPWLVEAQQQQRPVVQQRRQSPHEGLDPEVLHTLEATKIPQPLETPLTPDRRKKTLSVDHNKRHIKNDASAIATLAPADSAVAAPPARRSSGTTAGLSSPQIARSLEDWEVEDFVLLATVDGKLHARDRKTGKEKWALLVDKPMVETTYHRRHRSSVEENYDPISIDDYLWIVEPSRDGSLYIYRPGGQNPGLVNTGLTMKKLVEEMCPYGDEDPPVMYTGKKETTLITVDAKDGTVLKWFGSTGALVNDESCLNYKGFVDTDSAECATSATLTLGRTEYTVGIAGKDGHKIATLKFSEWSPNNYDHDLQRQYHTTLDNKYIYTSHDGGVIGFDHDRSTASEPGRLFKHKFSSPVVRVFDVARPWGTERDDPELIILPQPMPPNQFEDEVSANHRQSSIFLNHTEDGSWYAMSGKSYPLAVQGIRLAQCNEQAWRQHRPQWDTLNDIQLSEALVGLHSVDNGRSEGLLAISAPSLGDNQSNDTASDNTPALLVDPTILQRFQRLPTIFVNSVLEFIKNPVLILVLIAILASNQRQIRAWVGRHGAGKSMLMLESSASADGKESDQLIEIGEKKATEIPNLDGAADQLHPKEQEVDVVKVDATVDKESVSAIEEAASPEKASQDGTAKKKAHRGRRGGVKHKKGQTRAASQDESHDGTTTPKATPTIEDAVRDAQKMGEQTKLEPDIRTVPNDPSEVSGPIIRVGALEVNTEDLIGTGSNGTMVFKGNFDGREVAVKRMLIQFFDIASQETKLLRESDDHPNGTLFFLLYYVCDANTVQSFVTSHNNKLQDFSISLSSFVLPPWLM